MDPKSTYLLEIKLLGNPKKVRKDVRCFCFDKVVDSDTTNLKALLWAQEAKKLILPALQ